jgi:hypothetical protein
MKLLILVEYFDACYAVFDQATFQIEEQQLTALHSQCFDNARDIDASDVRFTELPSLSGLHQINLLEESE